MITKSTFIWRLKVLPHQSHIDALIFHCVGICTRYSICLIHTRRHYRRCFCTQCFLKVCWKGILCVGKLSMLTIIICISSISFYCYNLDFITFHQFHFRPSENTVRWKIVSNLTYLCEVWTMYRYACSASGGISWKGRVVFFVRVITSKTRSWSPGVKWWYGRRRHLFRAMAQAMAFVHSTN